MKRVLLAIALVPFAWVWLFVPPLCLFLVLWQYAWKGPTMSVAATQKKCKDLRKHLVTWLEALRPGEWKLGIKVAEEVKQSLIRLGIFTSGEVLMKELRKAQRKGEIRKRLNEDRMVEYTALPPAGMLFVVDERSTA